MILVVAVTAGAAAQDMTKKVHKIAEVVVTEKRKVKDAAVTKTVIDTTALAESTNGSLTDLLSTHTPVFIKTYGLGSLATISFRGTAASHTQVEWNGININNPMLGQVDFSLIPVWFVDKVELYHGGSSLQQGSGALGGSVELGSSARWDRKLYGSVIGSVGSFGTYQGSTSIGGGNRKVQGRVRYLYEQAENDFAFFNNAVLPFREDRQSHADYKKNGAVADLYWNAGEGNFFALNGWFHHAKRNLPHIMSYQGRGRTEKQTDQDIRLVGRWNKYFKSSNHELVAGYTHTNLDYYLMNETDLGSFLNYDSRSTINSTHLKLKEEWNIGENTLVRLIANGSYHKVSILDHITQEGYTKERTEAGISGSIHHKLTKQLSAFALLREDIVDGKLSPVMPSVGIDYSPLDSDALSIALNATRNYHYPTLNDKYWLPGGNPDLRPEKGYTGDISVSYRMKGEQLSGSLSATGYISSIDDWIIWQPSEFRYWTATNLKKVLARGVELNGQAKLQTSRYTLGLHANYGYTRTTNEEPTLLDDQSKGKQLIYIPIHKGSVMVDAQAYGFYLYYTVSLTSERFTTSSNNATAHTLPAYDLHNFTIGKEMAVVNGKIDVQLKLNNLTNKDYQAILWRPMPRRSYMLIVKYTF